MNFPGYLNYQKFSDMWYWNTASSIFGSSAGEKEANILIL